MIRMASLVRHGPILRSLTRLPPHLTHRRHYDNVLMEGKKVPQGTKLDELRALVRRHRARVLGDDTAGKLGAATTSAGNQFAQATDSASLMYEEAFNKATDTWSHSRLKSFLDARGIVSPCPWVPYQWANLYCLGTLC